MIISCSDNMPDADQIKADLMGKRIGSTFRGWIFESMNEFEKFEIVDQRRKGKLMNINAICDYSIQETEIYRAEALVTYTKKGNTWEFVYVSGVLYGKIN